MKKLLLVIFILMMVNFCMGSNFNSFSDVYYEYAVNELLSENQNIDSIKSIFTDEIITINILPVDTLVMTYMSISDLDDIETAKSYHNFYSYYASSLGYTNSYFLHILNDSKYDYFIFENDDFENLISIYILPEFINLTSEEYIFVDQQSSAIFMVTTENSRTLSLEELIEIPITFDGITYNLQDSDFVQNIYENTKILEKQIDFD